MMGDVRSRHEMVGRYTSLLVPVFRTRQQHVINGELPRRCQCQERTPTPDLNVVRMRPQAHDSEWAVREYETDHETVRGMPRGFIAIVGSRFVPGRPSGFDFDRWHL